MTNNNDTQNKKISARDALIHARKVSTERFNKMREREIVEKYNLKAK